MSDVTHSRAPVRLGPAERTVASIGPTVIVSLMFLVLWLLLRMLASDLAASLAGIVG